MNFHTKPTDPDSDLDGEEEFIPDDSDMLTEALDLLVECGSLLDRLSHQDRL